MRGIRGAITVEENTAEAIYAATEEMVSEIMARNGIKPEDIGAALFSATDDLTAGFPATGARRIEGFRWVPLFDVRQKNVDGALEHCIRAMLLVDTDKKQQEIKHVYLGGAAKLRPDLKDMKDKK